MVALSNNDGVAVARSNEVKALGIKMAEPWFKMERLAKKHGIIALSSNYSLYGDMSARVMSILSSFSPKQEIYSIDECFLDLEGFDPQPLMDYPATDPTFSTGLFFSCVALMCVNARFVSVQRYLMTNIGS